MLVLRCCAFESWADPGEWQHQGIFEAIHPEEQRKEIRSVECVKCGSPTGPLHTVDADHPGWLCPECLKIVTAEHAGASGLASVFVEGERVTMTSDYMMTGTVLEHLPTGRVLVQWDEHVTPIHEDESKIQRIAV